MPITITDKSLLKEYETFDEAVDEFFSFHESNRLDNKTNKVERTALSKLERAKTQHATRIVELENAMEKSRFDASLIENNIELVDKAIFGVNDLVNQGMDWHKIAVRVREQATIGNPIASLIVSLDLHNNSIVLKLPLEVAKETDSDEADNSDYEDSEEQVEYHNIKVRFRFISDAKRWFI
eukprot:UN34308